MGPYIYLAIAIIMEVIATNLLKLTDGFTRLWPSIFTIVGYAISFYLLSRALEYLYTGIAYAIWSGCGIILVTIVGWIIFDQKIDLAAMIGMGFIIVGVLIINLLSNTSGH